mgnify:FL=1
MTAVGNLRFPTRAIAGNGSDMEDYCKKQGHLNKESLRRAYNLWVYGIRYSRYCSAVSLREELTNTEKTTSSLLKR